MYAHSERPLTDVERELLDNRLREVNEGIADAAFKVIVLFLFDGVVFFACAMVALGQDQSAPGVRIVALAAVVIANLALLTSALDWADAWRERCRVREALADGTAVVAQVEANAAACLRRERLGWSLFEVGEGRLLAVPMLYVAAAATGEPMTEPRLPACFELVLSRAHGLHLTTTRRGRASLPMPEPTDLALLVPDARRRRAVAERLDDCPLFPGALVSLRESLPHLEATELALPGGETDRGARLRDSSSPAGPWGMIQARVEEWFEVDFGPGGLAAALAALVRGKRQVLTAAGLLEVVRGRLPAGGGYRPRPVRPAFCRLRDALVSECWMAQDRVRPSARLEDLVPRARRADCWERLGSRLRQPLPPFAPADTPPLVWGFGSLGLILLYAVGVPIVRAIEAWAVAGGFQGTWWFRALGFCLVPTSFMAGIVLAFGLPVRLFRNRYRLEFQAAYATVGQLARFLAETGAAEEAVPWTDEAVWLALRGILADAVGKLPSTITQDTNLSADLGLRLPAEALSEDAFVQDR